MAKKVSGKNFEHNHQRKLLELVKSGKIPTGPGMVSALDVYHDDWCALLAGTGPCNCDPTIKIGWVQHPGSDN